MFTQRSGASRAPLSSSAGTDEFARAVEYYLTLQPRQLPSRYLYDALGSALFEAICELPWYHITRAELRLLEANRSEIYSHAARLARIVELGPGKGAKLVKLVEGQPAHARRLQLHLVDMSGSALAAATFALSGFDVDVVPHQVPYEAGLVEAVRHAPADGRTLVLFLGSNIGNFDPPTADAFLRGLRAALCPADLLLLGADLVKPESELLLAYDDPLGVTAAFNRNLLVRINRDLGGNFDLAAYSHRAVWSQPDSRVEMHLVSRRQQRVSIPRAGVDLTMADGEAIWTESSYKYRSDEIVTMLRAAGFRRVEQWIDHDAMFALTLVEAV